MSDPELVLVFQWKMAFPVDINTKQHVWMDSSVQREVSDSAVIKFQFNRILKSNLGI